MATKPKLTLSVQHADTRLSDMLKRTDIRRWVQAAQFAPAEFTIRFVDEAEGRALNRDYRGKDYATNVMPKVNPFLMKMWCRPILCCVLMC